MYLVQEWIYGAIPMLMERYEQYFDSLHEAEDYYSNREKHLKAAAQKRTIFPSFVRMFKMKKSSLTDNGWGVDRCLKITYEPEILL